jgi:hypothetical protein
VVALRRTGAPCSPRNWVSGGSHRPTVMAGRGAASAVTAVAASPVSSRAHRAGSLIVAEARTKTASRPACQAVTRRSRRST